MNKVVAGALTGCLLGAGVASPALAASVYDYHGKLVGTLAGQAPDGSSLAIVNQGGQHNYVRVGFLALVQDDTPIFFSATNCGGQALIPYDWTKQVIPTAVWDGSRLWVGNPRYWANLFTPSKMVAGVCTNLGGSAANRIAAASPVSVPWVEGEFLVR